MTIEQLSGETNDCVFCVLTHPIEHSTYSDDGAPICPDCHTQWQASFNACAHEWQPHDGDSGHGRYCPKCCGFVLDDE